MKFSKYLNTVLKEQQENNKDLILAKSVKVTTALKDLITTQDNLDLGVEELEELLKDIRVISFKPTTFRIVFKNDNYFDLIYDPIKNSNVGDDYLKLFIVSVDGKRYHMINGSEQDQARDYITNVMKTKRIGANKDEDPTGGEEDVTTPEEDNNKEDEQPEQNKDKQNKEK